MYRIAICEDEPLTAQENETMLCRILEARRLCLNRSRTPVLRPASCFYNLAIKLFCSTPPLSFFYSAVRWRPRKPISKLLIQYR